MLRQLDSGEAAFRHHALAAGLELGTEARALYAAWLCADRDTCAVLGAGFAEALQVAGFPPFAPVFLEWLQAYEADDAQRIAALDEELAAAGALRIADEALFGIHRLYVLLSGSEHPPAEALQ